MVLLDFESGLPYAEDAKVTQKAQKAQKTSNKEKTRK
jgi:hypothetical protein